MPTLEGEILNEEDFGYAQGQSKFSPNGLVFVVACGEKVWLYYFDRCNGELVHYYTIDSIWAGNPDDYVNGLEFSLDGSKLYLTKRGASTGASRIYQYDLNADNIKASQVILHQNNTDYWYGHMQLAPNGKIYCTMPHDSPDYFPYEEPQNLSLSVIHNPNEAGSLCNYEHLSQYCGGKLVKQGLPNMPNYNLGVLPKSACDTLSTAIIEIEAEEHIKIYPNPADEILYIQSVISTNSTIQIFNMQGVLVLESALTGKITPVSVALLPAGVYAARFASDGEAFGEQMFVVE